MIKLSTAAAASLTALMSTSAMAQHSETIVMRKTIEATSEAIPTPWLPAKDRTYAWSSTQDHEVPASCGKVSVPQTVMCKDDLGAQAQDRFCRGTRPPTSVDYVDYRSCTYAWSSDKWSEWSSTCSDAATRTRAVRCLRSDGNQVQTGCDPTTHPVESETAPQTDSCTYAWKTFSWSPYSSYCSDTATRTRQIACERSDGKTVDQAQCGGGRPATSEQNSVLEACRFYWKVDSWADPSPSCGAAVRTAVMSCHRSASDGSQDITVPEAQCANSTKPASVEAFDDTRACTYAWIQDKWSAWSSSCSDSATRTKTPYCVKSNGTTVHDSMCDSKTKPAVATETSAQYSGCAARWAYGSVSPAYPNGVCVNGSIGYTSYPICVDAANKQIADTNCTKNAALVKPATKTGTAACTAINTFLGAPYGYGGTGYNGMEVPVKSYPGQLTAATALTKAIEQCTTMGHVDTSRYKICQLAGAYYYPKVNRTYVLAGIHIDQNDARSEPLPTDSTGMVNLGLGAQWQQIDPGVELRASDAAFSIKGWNLGKVTLNSNYGFYVVYTAK